MEEIIKQIRGVKIVLWVIYGQLLLIIAAVAYIAGSLM